MALSAFTLLCNHHHSPPRTFSLPEQIITTPQSPQAQAPQATPHMAPYSICRFLSGLSHRKRSEACCYCKYSTLFWRFHLIYHFHKCWVFSMNCFIHNSLCEGVNEILAFVELTAEGIRKENGKSDINKDEIKSFILTDMIVLLEIPRDWKL